MEYRRKILLLLIINLFNSVLSDEKHKAECKRLQKNAIRLSATCCLLTRPSIEPEYKDCRADILDGFSKKTNLTLTEKLALNICIEECVYINNGYINADPPYSINAEFLATGLVKIMPAPKEFAVKFMYDAYQRCEKFHVEHPKRLNINFPSLSITENICASYALEITSCVRIFAMQNCPNGFYDDSKECEDARKYFTECVANVKNIK